MRETSKSSLNIICRCRLYVCSIYYLVYHIVLCLIQRGKAPTPLDPDQNSLLSVQFAKYNNIVLQNTEHQFSGGIIWYCKLYCHYCTMSCTHCIMYITHCIITTCTIMYIVMYIVGERCWKCC